MSIDPDNFMEVREAHYKRHLGPLIESVMHSNDVKLVHIDVYSFEPNANRPFWTLITGGMSDDRQFNPEDEFEPDDEPDDAPEINPRTEILMYVAEPRPWMFSVLKGLAEMPFEDDTFLHWRHTVPNGQPMTATPSLLTSFLVREPLHEDAAFRTLMIDDDRVDFLWLVPITEAERQFAIKYGSAKLEERLDAARVPQVVDESRKSVVSYEESWRFDQPPNCSVLSLKSIIFNNAPILHVSHDADDHGWQFLGAHAADPADAAVVSLLEIVNLDFSVVALHDLPPGRCAWRTNLKSPWQRAPKTTTLLDKFRNFFRRK